MVEGMKRVIGEVHFLITMSKRYKNYALQIAIVYQLQHQSAECSFHKRQVMQSFGAVLFDSVNNLLIAGG